MVSIIIPARNEIYLQKTLEDILSNAEGDIEVLVMLDGYVPDPKIDTKDSRVVFYHYKDAIGQRQCVNAGVKLAKGKYIMKLDAHCALDKGFDVKLANDCEYNWTIVPRMYNLDSATWTPKLRKRTDYMYITFLQGKEFRMEYYTGELYRKLHRNPLEIDDTMCLVGCCFFMHKDRFWELGGMDEGHGGWGQMGCELSCKAWLSGGALKVNKKTWFAHYFRGGGGPGFPYPITGRSVKKARDYSINLWLNNKWEKQVRPFQWMLDKFKPPKWIMNETKDISALKNKHKGKVCHIVGNSESVLKLKPEMFSGPVIALNESIEKVEALNLPYAVYAMMKDGGDKTKCPDCEDICGHLIKPKKAPLLLSKAQSNDCQPGHPLRYIFDTKQWFGKDVFSTCVALRIAKLMGCRKVKLLCCEGTTDRVSHGASKNRRSADLYHRHATKIRSLIEEEGLEVEWMDEKAVNIPKYVLDSKGFRFLSYNRTITKKRFPNWRGHGLIKQPADIVLYHQAIWKNRPDFIIETGTAHGGSALFFADMLELTGKGKVISIDIAAHLTPPHPRVIYIKGSSINPKVIEQVKDIVGNGTCMIVLDSNHSRLHVKWELHRWWKLVSKGHYLVVEDCYVRGKDRLHGPGQALNWFMKGNSRFKRTRYEEQFLAVNTRGGWLKRR